MKRAVEATTAPRVPTQFIQIIDFVPWLAEDAARDRSNQLLGKGI